MKDNIVADKSKKFALRIIKLYKYLLKKYREKDMARQLLRCGTSIGANVRESVHAASRADFYAKLNIALKEAGETEYWLEILHESDYLTEEQFESIYADCRELIRLLVSILKTKGENGSV